MCGIVGYTGTEDSSQINKMNQVQHHRGPDESGMIYHSDGKVHLAMKRLSIVDLLQGQQPMYSEDEQYCIVFNGEIFNSAELRNILEKKGYHFKSKSDTEVLLKYYIYKGEKCVKDLNGMFAFVIHDRKNNYLFGARDSFGIKPFHYHMDGARFSFASEIKSLLVLPWIKDDINTQAVHHYLGMQTIVSPYTIYSDIQKLPPAYAFKYDLKSCRINKWKYWNPTFGTHKIKDTEELKKEIQYEFHAAVKRWTQSDVPICTSLSGGLDSSLITASCAMEGKRISTFSLGFPDTPNLDESPLSRMVASKYNTDHTEINITEQDLLNAIPNMMKTLDEPYAGGLPSWFVYKEVQKKGYKVALTGTGGDELFGNYGKWMKYEKSRIYHEQLKNIWKYRDADFKDIMLSPHGSIYYSYFTDGEKKKYLLKEPIQSIFEENSASLIERIWKSCPSTLAKNQVAWVDLHIQLPEEFLYMTDRFSMFHSVEARTPFLDKKFSEFIYSIPAVIRTKENDYKYLLKESLGHLLPEALLYAPKKGFVLPMEDWLKKGLKSYVMEYLSPEYIRKQGIFKPDLHAQYVKPFFENKSHNSWDLWTLLMFQLWYANK